MYRVSVTRQGVRRTTDMTQQEARLTVHEAVSRGLEVSCRKLGKKEPLLATPIVTEMIERD